MQKKSWGPEWRIPPLLGLCAEIPPKAHPLGIERESFASDPAGCPKKMDDDDDDDAGPEEHRFGLAGLPTLICMSV